MKTKEEEIKAIKDEQRKLADRLEALEQPEPQAGEVWVTHGGSKCLELILGHADLTESVHFLQSVVAYENAPATRLGTFDEVYIERSKVQEEYIKKDDLSAALSESTVKDLSGVRTRRHISGKFNLSY
jgi:hypothetical protein